MKYDDIQFHVNNHKIMISFWRRKKLEFKCLTSIEEGAGKDMQVSHLKQQN